MNALRKRAPRTRCLTGLLLCLAIGATSLPLAAADRIHFLIPAGAGGGLDGTARAVGRDLAAEGLTERVSFENMTGGSSGKAIAHLIETAQRQQDTLIVLSTPLLIRSLQGVFPYGFRDLTPVAAMIGDYGVFIVNADSPLQSFADLLEQLGQDPRAVKIGGGSVRGSLDHLVFAMAADAAGLPARRIPYVPYDGGGRAMTGLLAGEVGVLSTGVGEILPLVAAGSVRVLAVTAPERLPALPDAPTLTELGYPVTFVNWRGFFAAPGVDPNPALAVLTELTQTPAWRETLNQYGWQPLFHPGADYTRFLTAQESTLQDLLSRMGFVRSKR